MEELLCYLFGNCHVGKKEDCHAKKIEHPTTEESCHKMSMIFYNREIVMLFLGICHVALLHIEIPMLM